MHLPLLQDAVAVLWLEELEAQQRDFKHGVLGVCLGHPGKGFKLRFGTPRGSEGTVFMGEWFWVPDFCYCNFIQLLFVIRTVPQVSSLARLLDLGSDNGPFSTKYASALASAHSRDAASCPQTSGIAKHAGHHRSLAQRASARHTPQDDIP